MKAAQFPYFDAPRPLALAHRGGALYGPNVGKENTLAAFRAAHDLGYRYLETDVHATADGQVVAFHDSQLDRVTDRAGAIAELPWAAVREARVAGEPVPLLAELLEALPDARFNIDIKAPSAVVPTAQAVLQAGALDRVCVGSFSQRRLRHVRELLGPRLATAAGGAGVASLRFLPRLVTQWLRTPAPVLQIPRTYTLAGRVVELVTPALVEAAHRRGKQIHVWTIDDAAEMHELLDLGVDGLVSDAIDTLRGVLLERGAWQGPPPDPATVER
ncbi:glycerophosphodiester phosphodiesterase family protein [Arsenicicoccus sp. oral taxon 190]|uniref:glycerophosphodiester phosphodiesterase family protein n=1 Tax=Arsenicicoccus sp. oral taxon 190 TaxID=1658671 RepID=UPI00067A3DC4|nr:glycerophosphodiester phosphodiesterase family protein [Arsenicicoccus sp. oral taxon 190]AKT51508.1 glycerophosphodiester phosphodiesterase [Arsenicicoccus sp. oral taxon 190]